MYTSYKKSLNLLVAVILEIADAIVKVVTLPLINSDRVMINTSKAFSCTAQKVQEPNFWSDFYVVLVLIKSGNNSISIYYTILIYVY